MAAATPVRKSPTEFAVDVGAGLEERRSERDPAKMALLQRWTMFFEVIVSPESGLSRAIRSGTAECTIVVMVPAEHVVVWAAAAESF